MAKVKNIKLADGTLLELGGSGISNVTNCLTAVPNEAKVEVKGDFVNIGAGKKCVFPFGDTSRIENLDIKLPVGTIIHGYKVLEVKQLPDPDGSQFKKWFVVCELIDGIENASIDSSVSQYICPAIPKACGGFIQDFANYLPPDGSNYIEYYGIDTTTENPTLGYVLTAPGNGHGYNSNMGYNYVVANDWDFTALPLGHIDANKDFTQFSGFGNIKKADSYDGYYSAFVYDGVSGLIADGYDDNSVVKNIPVTSTFAITNYGNDLGGGVEDEEATFYLTEDSYVKADVTYDKETNLHYTSGGEVFKGVKCQQITRVDNNYEGNYEIITEKPFRSCDYNDYQLEIENKLSKSGDTMTGELIIEGLKGGGQIRLVDGDYGLIFRKDSSAFYMLLTEAGDPYGAWNSLRPFTLNLSTGRLGLPTFGQISKTKNGYCKLDNGLIIQWGTRSTISHDKTASITFPLAFSSASSYAFTENSALSTGSTSGSVSSSVVTSYKNTGVTLLQDCGTDSGARWIAIGY